MLFKVWCFLMESLNVCLKGFMKTIINKFKFNAKHFANADLNFCVLTLSDISLKCTVVVWSLCFKTCLGKKEQSYFKEFPKLL